MEEKLSESDMKKFKKRRNSYSAAMEEENIIEEPDELTRRQSVVARWNNQKKKLTNVSSLESRSSSSGSSTASRRHRRISSLDITRSFSGNEIEIPETFLAHPEITSKLLRSHFLAKKFMNECQCQSRKDSLASRDSFSSYSFRLRDSTLSVSTCQSVLAPSTERNSITALTHYNSKVQQETQGIRGLTGRRHSDQTHTEKNSNNHRRLSDQTPMRNPIDTENRAGGYIVKSYRSFSNDIRDQITSCRCKYKNDSDRRLSLSRRDSNQSISSFRRDSLNPVTPKMLRRRFSEQLILEGGLRNEPEFEDLVEENDIEESLTAINARKKITLKRHYYLEGGWGYVILVVATFVQLMCHGLHMGSGVLLIPVTRQFDKDIIDAGRTIMETYDP